ncbi:unnamed protein product [Lepeophtheirus salmonis]|uniref:(salmon louse) hypothetical protein n=1 Tax=Lepeophtheirus salmonis TaxID=72036 RepID=A0A7R8D030_LEPSM|nr:unnamed protein product [Lepeophtheirus salmonis]CAF2979570.1 unnamed protein product [Lepeophtheirus salmonis]
MHALKKKCHTTHFTDYVSAPEKKCETTFKKNCHITFKQVPHNQKVKKCRTPIIQKCQEDNICSTHYETLCETLYKNYELEQEEPVCKKIEELRCKNVTHQLLHIPHDKEGGEGISPFLLKEECEMWPVKKCKIEKKKVTKVHPKTECKNVGRNICISSNCTLISVPGPEVCHDETQTQVQSIPQEECDLEPPQENCRVETSLVPKLTPTKKCVNVPKEICVSIQRKIQEK